MFSAAGGDEDKGSSPISSKSALTTEQRIQNWMQLVESHAPAEQIREAEKELGEALKQEPYQLREQLPFFQKAVRAFDATQVFQHFRLPGGRIVEDKRDESAKEAKETAKEEGKRQADVKEKKADQMHMKDGKLVRSKERDYVNYLGDRKMQHGGLDRSVAEQRVDKLLSSFEKMVVAHFEDGKSVTQEIVNGKIKFLAKTEAEWAAFFKAFLGRTVSKKVGLAEIQNFLLRGVIPKGSKGVVISDMRLSSGRVEKFIRFSVLSEAMAKLKEMSPGDVFGKNMLEGLKSEELMFLALAVSRGREFATTKLPSQGKFVDGKAELEAAKALGLPIDQHLRDKAKALKKGRSRSMGGLFGEGEPEEIPYTFVPWWSFNSLKSGGPKRTVTAVFYGTLLILAIIGIVLMTYHLL